MIKYFKSWNWDIFTGCLLVSTIGILSNKSVVRLIDGLIFFGICVFISLFLAWLTREK